jgi:hypothetical protein
LVHASILVPQGVRVRREEDEEDAWMTVSRGPLEVLVKHSGYRGATPCEPYQS